MCCSSRATCGDIDGPVGPNTDHVKTSLCEAGFEYNPGNASALCLGMVCDVIGVSTDHDLCCVQSKATCGEASGYGSPPVSDVDCGEGFVYDTRQADYECTGLACDIGRRNGTTNVPTDRAACCEPVATCGDKDGTGIAWEPVNNTMCGGGHLYRGAYDGADAAVALDAVAAVNQPCKGMQCDPANVLEDKSACCVKRATCSDADGAGPGNTSVSDSLCSAWNAIYDVAHADYVCKGPTCDVMNVLEDRAHCCIDYGRCAIIKPTSEECGNGEVYDSTAVDYECQFKVCDYSIERDRAGCCTPVATCGDRDGVQGAGNATVSDEECGIGFVYDERRAANKCQDATCDARNNPRDKLACCVPRAACGDADGADAGTDGVTSAQCGTDYVSAQSVSETLQRAFTEITEMCRGRRCDPATVPEDKNTCCVLSRGTCGDRDSPAGNGTDAVSDSDCGFPGTGLVYAAENASKWCEGKVCDTLNSLVDRRTCCVEAATCDVKDRSPIPIYGGAVTSDDCGEGFVARPRGQIDSSTGAARSYVCHGRRCDIRNDPRDKDSCCQAQATCDDIDGPTGPGLEGVTDGMCDVSSLDGDAMVVDVKRSRSYCEGWQCDPVNNIVDQTTCCISVNAPGSCDDKDGPGKGVVPISDADCAGAEYIYDATASSKKCAGSMCDASVVGNADHAACCTRRATCGDADGDGPSTAPVQNDQCNHLHVYDATTANYLCAGPTCVVNGTNSSDHGVCCRPVATCGDKDGAGPGMSPLSNADCGAGYMCVASGVTTCYGDIIVCGSKPPAQQTRRCKHLLCIIF